MEYKNIKDFLQRCEEHPDHQMGMITSQMVQDRLSEEIDELRKYIEQRTWIGLTNEEVKDALRKVMHSDTNGVVRAIEAKLKAKNFA